jgi:transcriptional regulator with XRE-family HTH domain
MNGLRALRQQHLLTQGELADKLGVRYQTVGTWEMGTARPRPAMMRKLCEILEVTPVELLATLDEQEIEEGKIAA